MRFLWCGWNGDVLPGDDRLLVGLPVARDNGRPITGKIHVEICRDERVACQPLYWGPWARAALSAGQPRHHGGHAHDAAATIGARRSRPVRWLGLRPSGKRQLVADPGAIWVRDGIRPGWLYDLVYVGHDPRVVGLGLAAIRDCTSFFRYDAADRRGNANPLAGCVDRACLFGISQSGRAVRHFLFAGFNTDQRQRLVFDAALAHVAGSGRLFTQRFGVLTVCSGPHENLLAPTEQFPFTTVPETDPLTGRHGDLLARAARMPKIFLTQTSTEYWTRAASLTHTDVDGRQDVAWIPTCGCIALREPSISAADRPIAAYARIPAIRWTTAAPCCGPCCVALDRWASTGRQPPESRYPRLADGTLVDLPAFGKLFPPIPGVNLPGGFYRPFRLDFGPRWESEGIADCVPPRAGPVYRTLVPAVDADGNEVAGIRLPDVAVPLGTYTGWNLRGAACGAEGMLVPYHGSYLPLRATPDERRRTVIPALGAGALRDARRVPRPHHRVHPAIAAGGAPFGGGRGGHCQDRRRQAALESVKRGRRVFR